MKGMDTMATDKTAWERVATARHPKRPTSIFYIENLFDNFVEMHGDRQFADDPAVIAGIGWFNGIPVTVIGIEKGIDTNDRIRRNFGSPHPEGYRKALRLMRQAEKFHRPVICFVDTQGAYAGIGAEERGQAAAIAENLMIMSRLQTPIISMVIGEGGSGGALALAVADRVAVLENAIYSILSPEGFASILWKDSSRAQEAAEVMKLTATDLLELGVIDDVILEPEDGAQNDTAQMLETVRNYIDLQIHELIDEDIDTLVAKRYTKFRNMGKATLQ